jgi:hypothetical protein
MHHFGYSVVIDHKNLFGTKLARICLLAFHGGRRRTDRQNIRKIYGAASTIDRPGDGPAIFNACVMFSKGDATA